MKAKQKIKKVVVKSGSVRITPAVLVDAKIVCARQGILIQDYVSDAVRKENLKNNV